MHLAIRVNVEAVKLLIVLDKGDLRAAQLIQAQLVLLFFGLLDDRLKEWVHEIVLGLSDRLYPSFHDSQILLQDVLRLFAFLILTIDHLRYFGAFEAEGTSTIRTHTQLC